MTAAPEDSSLSPVRRGRRKAVRTEIRFGDDCGLGDILLDSRDLSEGGAFIASDLFFDLGEELDLEFEVPATDRSIRARGRIVWVTRGEDGENPAGMGVEFIDLSDEDRAALTEFVEEP